MANIKMSPDSARGMGANISKCKGDVDTIVKKLEGIICGELKAQWEGEAQKAYEDQFLQLKESVMNKFGALLESLGKQLQDVANATEEYDIQQGKSISSSISK